MNPETTDGQLVRFAATDGLELSGFIAKSSAKAESVMIHIHGMGSSFYGPPVFHKTCREALGPESDLFTVNTRGAGLASTVTKGDESLVVGTTNEVFEDCVKDIAGAIEAAKSLGYGRIVLSGHSTGCQKITYYQSVTRNESVGGLILLAPADDYNVTKKELGDSFTAWSALAKAMVDLGRGTQMMPEVSGVSHMSAQRFNSVSDVSREEAQLFNYETGDFMRFSSVKCPVIAIFGEREQYRTMPVRTCMKVLESHARCPFEYKIVPGADHDFRGRESVVSKQVATWLKKVLAAGP